MKKKMDRFFDVQGDVVGQCFFYGAMGTMGTVFFVTIVAQIQLISF